MHNKRVLILLTVILCTGCYSFSFSGSMDAEAIGTMSLTNTVTNDFLILDRKYEIWHWVTLGGLVFMFLPAVFEESDLGDAVIFTGFVSYTAGVPFMGRYSGQMRSSAEQNDHHYKSPWGGWKIYWIGKGVQTIGMTLICIEGLRMALTIFVGTKPNETLINTGAGLIGAGFLFDFAAWYRFGKVRNSAKESLVINSALLKLFDGGERRLVPGVVIKIDF